MLDKHLIALIKPSVDKLASAWVRVGIKADHVTLAAFVIGMLAMISIALQAYLIGAGFILASRLCDALDGAVARQSEATDAGGYLDITLDFLFYASIPLAFAYADPLANALPAAALLAAFIGTGSSFLAFAALASKRGLKSMDQPDKSFYFLGGLTEATETLIVFIAMCLWPSFFPELAYGFSLLCAITIGTRVIGGYLTLKK
jgi:phosphatidylglycerophosphate synthase